MKWRPSDDDKKYIEETLRSLVDNEDLCCLLMIAMATELERQASSEHEHRSIDQHRPNHTLDQPLNHVVQSPPDDQDHGDDLPNTPQRVPSSLQEMYKTKATSTAFTELNEQLTENVGHQHGDNGTIVVKDANKSDSFGTASFTIRTKSTAVSMQDAHVDKLIDRNLAWLTHQSENKQWNTLEAELMEANRVMSNTDVSECKHVSQTHNSNAYCLSALEENLRSPPIGPTPRHTAATNETPTNTGTLHPSVERHQLASPVSCTMNDAAETAESDISVISRPVLGSQRDKHANMECSHHDTDCRSMENRKSLVAGSQDTEKSTKTEAQQTVEWTEENTDVCMVTFRPRRQAIPVPIRLHQPINHVNRTPPCTTRHALNVTSSSGTSGSTKPIATGRDGRSKSTTHDVKCALRRKTVAV